MGNHYETLGLQRDASKADIKNAYFRLAHLYHPDHHNNATAKARAQAGRRFRKAKDAYDVLSDDHSRANYDRKLHRSSSSKQGSRKGGASSSSSSSSTKHGNQHGHGGYRSGPPPPRPRGGIGSMIFQTVFVGAYVVLSVLGTLEQAGIRTQPPIKRQIKMRKQQWENMKQEWDKKNPWKSWMESREKEKKKNWWLDIFRS